MTSRPGTAHDLLCRLDRLPEFEGYKNELIDGTIRVRRSATPLHNCVKALVASALVDHGWWALCEQALISPVRGYEPKPDVAVTSAEQAADNAHPYPADRVVLTVEIDPNDGTCQLRSEPDRASYRVVRHSRFGEPIALPKPFGFDVETDRFKVYPPSA